MLTDGLRVYHRIRFRSQATGEQKYGLTIVTAGSGYLPDFVLMHPEREGLLF
jgi:hypothetical protein